MSTALPFTPAGAEEIREHYDSLAFVYRTYWGDHIHHGFFETGEESAPDAQLKMLQHCLSLLPQRQWQNVFDVGCGHGGTSTYLAQRFGCHVTGLTLSEKQQKLATENAAKGGVGERARFVVGNADFYDFPEAACDLVWTMESSEHFADKSRYFPKVARMLQPGGCFMLAAWTGSMENPLVQQIAREFLCPEFWTPEQYRAAIEGAGLKVLEQQDITAHVIRTWEICRDHAKLAGPAVMLLPKAAREFIAGIDTILEGYRTRQFTYTLMAAQKP